MDYLYYVAVFLFGLAIGSFLSAYTFRLGVGKSVKNGRSFCPNCKKKIAWFDNIPLLSYLILQGKCRSCNKKISTRYPIIEFSTATLFAIIFWFFNNCATTFKDGVLQGSAVCFWSEALGVAALPYLLFIAAIMIAIFVIDFEQMIIPDELVYISLAIIFFALLFSSTPLFFQHIASGFIVSFVFLLLHLITKGKGMGLGDVKLAIPIGMLLNWQNTLVWFFLSFVIGAVVGLLLITAGKAKLGKQIAFGPFMIVSFFITLFIGNCLFNTFFPIF